MKALLTVLMIVAILAIGVLPVLAQDAVVVTEAYIDSAGSPPYVKAAWQIGPNQRDTQLVPNTADAIPNQGSETQICVWAVVTDPNGIGDITDVFFQVFHPDGTEKVQVHMTRLLEPADWEAAKRLALNTGQITVEQALELDEELEKNHATMWYGCWTYHTHQPCGVYTTGVTVVDQAGNVGSLRITLDILCVYVLAVDFSEVDFGGIVPNAAKWVMGNKVFSPGDGRPTVWNQGNDPASLVVHNTAMVGARFGKLIIDFDVKLLGQTELYEASEQVLLYGPLLPCTPEQIDFSVHPPYGIPTDVYTGTIDVTIVPAVAAP